jgi:CheY-like chemotaxis protein
MGTGASAVTKLDVPLETFRSMTEEYEKLKLVGLSVEEMHLIFKKRMNSSTGDVAPSKSDDVRLPTVVTSLENGKSPLQSLRSSWNIGHPGCNGVVLLIDDSLVASKVATKVLEQFSFEVVSANSAKQGFDVLLARRDEIVLVLLDVVMPTVDGVECLGWIKQHPDVAHIPIYMLSGLEDQLLADVCTERGAEGMILKPLNFEAVKEIATTHNLETNGNSVKLVPHAAKPPADGVEEGKHGSDHGAPGTGHHHSRSPGPSHSHIVNKISVGSAAGTVQVTAKVQAGPGSVRAGAVAGAVAGAGAGAAGRLSNAGFVGGVGASSKMNRVVTNSKARVSQVAVEVHGHGPAFKLCNSELNMFTFPDRSAAAAAGSNTYLVFVPTLFCPELYTESGFMTQLFSYQETLVANGDAIVIISADLPFSLAAAKRLFSLPFPLLSDPALHVALRYVGQVDIGNILARLDPELLQHARPHTDNYQRNNNNNNGSDSGDGEDPRAAKTLLLSDTGEVVVDYSEHPQNSFMAPNLGIVYISNSTREVLRKFLGTSESLDPLVPNFCAFPLDIIQWAPAPPPQQFDSPGGAVHGSPGGVSAGGGGSSQSQRNDYIEKQLSAPGTTGSSGSTGTDKEGKQPQQQQQQAGGSTGAGLKVLVVDDSSVSSRVVCRKLQGLDYAPSSAYHGKMAYDMLSKVPDYFDLVVTDVVMPVCDGMELLRMIQANQALRHIPGNTVLFNASCQFYVLMCYLVPVFVFDSSTTYFVVPFVL